MENYNCKAAIDSYSRYMKTILKKIILLFGGIVIWWILIQTAYYSYSPNNSIHSSFELPPQVWSTWEYLSWYIWKIHDPDFKTIPANSNFWKTFWVGNYRGALPTPDSIKLLKNKYGVKTIITLIPSIQLPPDSIDTMQDEWITWINIPLARNPPNNQDWQLILDALKLWHVFVHCVYGADRTWAIIARSRVELEWISSDQAYQDMLSYNPKVEKNIYFKYLYWNFKDFIYNGLK